MPVRRPFMGQPNADLHGTCQSISFFRPTMASAIDAGYTALVNISKEIDKLLAETQCNIQATSEAAARLVGHRATTIRQAKEIAELRGDLCSRNFRIGLLSSTNGISRIGYL